MGRVNSLDVLEGLEPTARDRDRTAARRDRVEVLRTRLELLGDADRALLQLYLEAGPSFHLLARLAGRNRSTVCRRIHRIIRRLCDDTYPLCRGHPLMFRPTELAVIRDHFVRGRSLRRICRDHRLGYYRARVIVAKARQFTRLKETV
jgi:hypothetical protein